MNRLTTLGQVLRTAGSLPWDQFLFLSRAKPWGWETPAAILIPEEDVDGEPTTPFARQNGLRYVLGMQDVQSIVENARAQLPQLDDNLLLKAFLYYYDHDAFITLE